MMLVLAFEYAIFYDFSRLDFLNPISQNNFRQKQHRLKSRPAH